MAGEERDLVPGTGDESQYSLHLLLLDLSKSQRQEEKRKRAIRVIVRK
jgi:hypothetical protein